jgi:Family of unknown function (DUF5996)
MTAMTQASWPELPLDAWAETLTTLQRWLQIVGKVRMVRTPPVNHSWHVTLYVSPRGLTTSAVPTEQGAFEIEFDFVAHQLVVRAADGGTGTMALRPRSVADFYRELQRLLRARGIEAAIYPVPNELPDALPFEQDEQHASYDPDYVHRFWRVLVSTDRVLRQFRSSFVGKCSPVHFFWGAADLAVTRFSGRPAPEHPGGVPNLPDAVVREAYSHEVSSAGFWPGTPGMLDYPAFYSYAYPEPPGFAGAQVRPDAAFYHQTLREFVLPYDAVRTASSPDAMLLEFLQSTYDAAATLGQWDRAALERGARV